MNDARDSPAPVASTSSLAAPTVRLQTPVTGAFASSSSSRDTAPIDDALARNFPDVATLSREDLTALLEDDAFFDAYFNTSPSALALHRSYEQKLQENIALAEKNEALRPKLEALRAETADLFSEANDLKARWSYIEAAQADIYQRFLPNTQLNRLRYATSGQEQLSESLVSSLLEGAMDEESFSRQYKEVRRVYHRRAGSLAKWEEGKVVWRT